jgi:UDP-N-acetyl-D-glucosamine dehydrogenase
MDVADKMNKKNILVGIIGLGYVGLPLVIAFSKSKCSVIGFDIDNEKVDLLNNGKSYIKHIDSKFIKEAIKNDFKATTNFNLLKKVDVILICVPTPVGKHREPDLQYVIDTSRTISKQLKKEHLVIMVSTTYPGTTEEIVLPILEESGLEAGSDFYLAYSPEREDPGNRYFNLSNVPKIIGALTKESLDLACSLFKKIDIETICL